MRGRRLLLLLVVVAVVSTQLFWSSLSSGALLITQEEASTIEATKKWTSKGSTIQYLDPIGLPRWNNTETPVDIQSILDVVDASLTSGKQESNQSFAETLYLATPKGVLVSERLRHFNPRHQIRHRMNPIEALMVYAKDLLFNTTSSNTTWPYAYQALTSKTGLPLLLWFGDYKGCLYKTSRNSKTGIPVFTNGVKHAGCQYAFAMPTYRTIRDAQPTAKEWDEVFANRTKLYGNSKEPRIVWRGSATDLLKNGSSQRWKMVQTAQTRPDLFDVGLLYNRRKQIPNVSSYASFLSSDELQIYTGILDIDGNAWSSRFGPQLCMHPVTLKVVPPIYVDHFYPTLQAWKHFIPVRKDFGDLIERAEWMQRNPDQVHAIRQYAHQWCRRHLVYDALARDLLKSWNVYAELIMKRNVRWSTVLDYWLQARAPLLNMTLVRRKLSPEKLAGRFPGS